MNHADDISRFGITLEKVLEKGEEIYSFTSNGYPDGGLTFSELLMIERIQDACDRLDKECDFEGACEVLRLIGWDEDQRIAVVLSQDEVDQVVELIKNSGLIKDHELNEDDR